MAALIGPWCDWVTERLRAEGSAMGDDRRIELPFSWEIIKDLIS
jgi:hypothetical protein